jgi:NADPH:quinone reductase-like Zn-dependent oxidoreductase
MKAVVYYEYGPPDEVLQFKDVEKPVVRADGVLVRVHGSAANPYDWHFIRGKPYFMRLMLGLRAPKRKADLETLAGLVDAGKLKPVIDRTYRLEEVPEAVRYVEQGHARGKVLVRINHAG